MLGIFHKTLSLVFIFALLVGGSAGAVEQQYFYHGDAYTMIIDFVPVIGTSSTFYGANELNQKCSLTIEKSGNGLLLVPQPSDLTFVVDQGRATGFRLSSPPMTLAL